MTKNREIEILKNLISCSEWMLNADYDEEGIVEEIVARFSLRVEDYKVCPCDFEQELSEAMGLGEDWSGVEWIELGILPKHNVGFAPVVGGVIFCITSNEAEAVEHQPLFLTNFFA